MSNPDKPRVIATRWWWVRHAPVREDDGCIYGQKDLGCDTSDRVVFEAVGKILPRNAVWYASNLKRTHQTAQRDLGRRLSQAVRYAACERVRRTASRRIAGHESRGILTRACRSAATGLLRVDEPAPGGESFMDLYNRACGAIERINAEQAGRDVIVVAHGGTIRAAVGLALGGQPEKGLAFDIDNCSVTRLDHLSSASYTGWRLPMVNQQPWIADASHNAMHQPAGPEVKPPETKLA